ncbi:MAG: hypothetical protein Q9190_007601 [Brigantiaea leucoxantha]
MAPPLHHLESQPDNLIASSGTTDELPVLPRSEVPENGVVNGTQEKAAVTSAPAESKPEPAAEKPEAPPLQPESKSGNKAVPWYHTSLAEIDPKTLEVLEQYSKIPSDQIIEHIFRIRQTLLDLGCCFAQDVRRLVFDGAPSENIYGADLYPQFMELGYELFQDRKSLKSTFFPTDILADKDLLLRGLDGEMDIVYLGLFLHHFDFETCVKVCVRVTKLLKPKKGSLVMGVQVGSLVGDKKGIPIPSGGILWRHDIESLKKVWELVGEETGTKWNVEARLERGKGFGEKWQLEGTRRLGFEVERVE